MNEEIKPRIIISKCIEFDNCRYNGQIITSNEVKEFKDFIEFIPICPEVEIGLGIPRDPIRVVYKNNQYNLLQPKTGKNVTKEMIDFSHNFLENHDDIDGLILKNRSPSCGLKEVKVYPGSENVAPIANRAGFFGQKVLDKYPYLAIEDEGRLRNPTIREHFLRKIFIFAKFREVKKQKSISSLIQFHTENILSNYESLLHQAFNRSPRCTSNINILLHSFGYISNDLSNGEKTFFLNEIERYRQAKTSLASIISILKSWIIRFNEPYLKQQSFFSPYPEQLVHAENIDSCKNRDYWQ